MAVWQFEFYAIDKVKKNKSDDILLWEKSIDEKIFNVSFLPKSIGWTNDIIQYGNSDGNCIEVLINSNGEAEEISIRIDLRFANIEFLRSIIEYMIKLGSNIYYNNEIYPSDISNLCSLIVKSDAYKFCNAPFEFLDNVENIGKL